MKSFLVGGSVRDELLGLPVRDRDYVVVGADPDEMAKQGFRPIGADFPVFLHPETHEEYALARTERKTAPGYKGFVFHADRSVTLQDDLRRRDLTINAMARAEDGTLIDPHGGAADLKAGVLRHVSEAFAEDPVRILRVARFAARFGFAVAPETMKLMERMVAAGEADALVPERVWQELARGLMERSPSRMIAVLRECGALARVAPEIDASFERPDVPELLAQRLDRAAARGYGIAVRFALLVLDLERKEATRLAERVNAPNECRDLALLAIATRDLVKTCDVDAESTLALLERADAFRRRERLDRLLEVAECDTHVDSPESFGPRKQLRRALAAARSVDAGAIAKEKPGDIADAVRRARLVAIASLQPVTGN
ncbi:MAG: multifunctional CCA tRNA nucleotidyl transferase/2'3'-cyclic phosphodiesterase/2'nucleotidase/phosphatase [Burkholderiales bacterium]|nr:multifunctional CCA tRNA nucleotidyl transferase/2'3'-cyclic phosphodiesterase/2'nucleotidase/phosphatase [Burkholderiales bacterium]